MNIQRHLISLLAALILTAAASSTPFAVEPFSEHYARLNLPQFPKSTRHEERLMIQQDPAVGLFLVATHHLGNSIFSETVILLIDHSMHGSVGLVINRPSDIKLSTAFPEINEFRNTRYMIYSGGPVNTDKITALFRTDIPVTNAIHVLDDIYAVSNIATLKDLLNKKQGSKDLRVYSGYAGWWAGQLEREIMRGSWHVIYGTAEAVFEYKSSRLWQDFQRQ